MAAAVQLRGLHAAHVLQGVVLQLVSCLLPGGLVGICLAPQLLVPAQQQLAGSADDCVWHQGSFQAC